MEMYIVKTVKNLNGKLINMNKYYILYYILYF